MIPRKVFLGFYSETAEAIESVATVQVQSATTSEMDNGRQTADGATQPSESVKRKVIRRVKGVASAKKRHSRRCPRKLKQDSVGAFSSSAAHSLGDETLAPASD